MPGASGLDLLQRVRASWPDVQVVVMTGYGSVADAVTAMKAGAADYLIKPVGKDELYLILDRALERRTLRAELVKLRQEVQDRYGFDRLIGATPAMVALYEDVAAVADSQATVLLQGATGTGKELLAHALHYRSRRAAGPFVRVNCTAIPETLLESELFGHEKGAFTGALREHPGRFEQADGGTLFLDEIGEIELGMQPKLLRALESGEIQRLGSRETTKVDVRVVAATNRDLRQEVAAGRFREDLFYRLEVVTLHVPPLRERLDDVPLLVEHFVREAAARAGRKVPRVGRDTMERLSHYGWPGNVRQLQHVVERAVILARGDVDVLEVPLPDDAVVEAQPEGVERIPVLPAPGVGLVDALDAHERAMIVAALKACGGVQAQAARRLGLSKSNLNYRIKRLGIEVKDIAYG
jgi:DNA-binding NtrC family response regulator